MLSAAFVRFISPPSQILNMIWLAMLTASIFYGAVAWFVTAGSEPAGGDFFVLQVALGSLSVVLVAGSFLYRRKALGEERLLGLLTGSAPAVPDTDDLDPVERRLAGLFPHYQTTNIVVMAMREAVGVLGLVLAIVSRDFWAFVPFGIVAVVSIAVQPPAVRSFMEKALPLAQRTS